MGAWEWSSTWCSLFFMPLDRQVIDLNWKLAHGVLYTAERLASFGYQLRLSCFCGHHTESLDHLFFSCPLAQSGLAWVQTLLAQLVHLCLYVTSVLAFLLTNSGLSRGSLPTWLMFVHTLYGYNATISVFILSLPVPLS